MKTESEVSIRISEKEVQIFKSFIWYIGFSIPIVLSSLYKHHSEDEAAMLNHTVKSVAYRMKKIIRRILNHG
jgi:hypothetical protein